jgi:hypothetical protein
MGLDWKRQRWGMEGRGETIYAFRAYRRRLRSRHEMTTTTTTRCPRPSKHLRSSPPWPAPHLCTHGADQEVAPSASTAQSPRRRRSGMEHGSIPSGARARGQDFNDGPPRVIRMQFHPTATARVKRQLFHNRHLGGRRRLAVTAVVEYISDYYSIHNNPPSYTAHITHPRYH